MLTLQVRLDILDHLILIPDHIFIIVSYCANACIDIHKLIEVTTKHRQVKMQQMKTCYDHAVMYKYIITQKLIRALTILPAVHLLFKYYKGEIYKNHLTPEW